MNTKPTLRWDDLVFENRNKMYGAYTIRQSYHSNLSRSSATAFFLFAALIVGSRLLMSFTSEPKTRSKPIVCTLLPQPLVIPEAKPQQQFTKPAASIDRNLPPRFVTAEIESPPIAPIEQPTTDVENGVGPDIHVDGTGVELSSITAVAEPTPTVDIAEVMPEFEGGLKALYKFLSKNLRYPSIAQRTGLEGTVYVRFVVDTEGSVTNIEVMRGVSGILDKEASRVISLLPKWKPGMQHNRPVNVRMMLPIKFKLGD